MRTGWPLFQCRCGLVLPVTPGGELQDAQGKRHRCAHTEPAPVVFPGKLQDVGVSSPAYADMVKTMNKWRKRCIAAEGVAGRLRGNNGVIAKDRDRLERRVAEMSEVVLRTVLERDMAREKEQERAGAIDDLRLVEKRLDHAQYAIAEHVGGAYSGDPCAALRNHGQRTKQKLSELRAKLKEKEAEVVLRIEGLNEMYVEVVAERDALKQENARLKVHSDAEAWEHAYEEWASEVQAAGFDVGDDERGHDLIGGIKAMVAKLKATEAECKKWRIRTQVLAAGVDDET